MLFGAELNAELERGRQIEQGLHPDQEPYVEPRDTRKMDDDEAARFEAGTREEAGRAQR